MGRNCSSWTPVRLSLVRRGSPSTRWRRPPWTAGSPAHLPLRLWR
uniref:Uncharacterized protein n=1 Tax=Arundo donax TaxID=35708 RepID=A0A0A9HM27_ARUDO